ncbi:MAG: hypothetical protein H0U72_07595 [Nitrosospira sp.]|nr:hypothetical protein [Nitrosospira sp.]
MCIRKHYRKARKKEKKPILDEFCANFDYHRKYAINRSRSPGMGGHDKPETQLLPSEEG